MKATAGRTSAQLECVLSSSNGIVETGFYLNYDGGSFRCNGVVRGNTIQVSINDLVPNTTYSGRFFISNGTLEISSESIEFHTTNGEAPINIEDPVFRRYLLREYDRNGDGELSRAELSAISRVDVSTDSISSLQGIEYMPYLRNLIAISNYGQAAGWLTQLNLKNNVQLEELIVYGNRLETLDVSMLPYLFKFNCAQNYLSSIDVSSNSELTMFWCNDNYISELDLSNNDKIEELWVSSNLSIRKLDLPNPGIIRDFTISDTRITEFDLSTMPELVYYRGNNLKLKDVPDFSANPKLEQIEIGNQGGAYWVQDSEFFTKFPFLKAVQLCGYRLEEIDLSKNTLLERLWIECAGKLKELDLSMMPNLTELACGYDTSLETIYIHPDVDLDKLNPNLTDCPAKIVVKY